MGTVKALPRLQALVAFILDLGNVLRVKSILQLIPESLTAAAVAVVFIFVKGSSSSSSSIEHSGKQVPALLCSGKYAAKC